MAEQPGDGDIKEMSSPARASQKADVQCLQGGTELALLPPWPRPHLLAPGCQKTQVALVSSWWKEDTGRELGNLSAPWGSQKPSGPNIEGRLSLSPASGGNAGTEDPPAHQHHVMPELDLHRMAEPDHLPTLQEGSLHIIVQHGAVVGVLQESGCLWGQSRIPRTSHPPQASWQGVGDGAGILLDEDLWLTWKMQGLWM